MTTLLSLIILHTLGGLLAGQHDNEKERLPPARPVPVTFPALDPPAPSLSAPPLPWTHTSPSAVAAHFLRLKKPSDVSLETLALLNVSFDPESDFETLLASISDHAHSHLPPRTWLEAPELNDTTSSEPNATLLCNGRKVPDQNEFYLRVKELSFKNEDAFANLTRKPRGEKIPLRLAHFRKFWEGLDNMAYYWDTSLDDYSTPSIRKDKDVNGSDQIDSARGPSSLGAIPPNEEEPRKKVKTEPMYKMNDQSPASAPTQGIVPPTEPSLVLNRGLPARAAEQKAPWEVNTPIMSEKPVDLSKGSYRGYRIGNGAEMPDSYRLETVRAFLEPIAWAFGVTLAPHRRPPVLQLERIRFPVRVSTVAWRGPQDRTRARQGWMEGPVLGVQCRAETNFGSDDDLQANSILDVVRELGGMLLVAQERAREAKTEKRAGEGKWWTTTPRWGGGPGGEVGEGKGASDAPTTESVGKTNDVSTGKPRVGSKDRRKSTPAEIWNTLKPGNPLWDPKVMYEAIGKDSNVEWDDVSLVT